MLRLAPHRMLSLFAFLLLACTTTPCFSMMEGSGDRGGCDNKRKAHDERKEPEKKSPVSDEKAEERVVTPSNFRCEAYDAEHCVGLDEFSDHIFNSRTHEIRRLLEKSSVSDEFGAELIAIASLLDTTKRAEMVAFLLGFRYTDAIAHRNPGPTINPHALYPDVLLGPRSIILLFVDQGDLCSIRVFLNAGFRIDQPVIKGPVEGDTIIHVLVRRSDALTLADMFMNILMNASSHPDCVADSMRALNVMNRRNETPLVIAEASPNQFIAILIRNFVERAAPIVRAKSVNPAGAGTAAVPADASARPLATAEGLAEPRVTQPTSDRAAHAAMSVVHANVVARPTPVAAEVLARTQQVPLAVKPVQVFIMRPALRSLVRLAAAPTFHS